MSQEIKKPSDAFAMIANLKNELTSVVIRMEQELRINPYENKNMRIEVKKLRELLK